MRIYLAGKIGKNDWRSSIVGARGATTLVQDEEWPEWDTVPQAIFGEHDYVGPFFIGDDHGCAHGESTHGAEANCSAMWRSPDADHCPALEKRNEIRRRCLAAIDSADLVFAWLTDTTAFGTLVEIGYAIAREIPVAIGMPDSIEDEGGWPLDDLWFASSAVDMFTTSDTPEGALKRVLADPMWRERKAITDRAACVKSALARCESPIETSMLMALLPYFPFTSAGHLTTYNEDGATSGEHKWVLAQQRTPAGTHYRPDFSIAGLAGSRARIIVECDGFDYHDRTKEQATRDKSRDRELTAAGWTVLRFTGQEIHKDAAACAKQVIDIATAAER